MLKAPSSNELPPGWAADEFDRYKEYMGDNWLPPPGIVWLPPPGLRHNGPPEPDPLARLTPWQIYIDCIWISDEDTNTKIMLLCIARFMDKQLRSSSMSYSQIANDCGFSEPTAKRCAKKVRARWLAVEVSKGRYVPGKGKREPLPRYHPARPRRRAPSPQERGDTQTPRNRRRGVTGTPRDRFRSIRQIPRRGAGYHTDTSGVSG